MSFQYESSASPGLLFWQTSTLWKRQINNVLDKLDLTHTQYVILAVLYHLKLKGERVNQKIISEISMIDMMTISSSVRLLEKKGFLFREVDKIDTRAKELSLTQKGEDIIKQAIPLVEGVDTSFFNLCEQELENLIDLLGRIKTKNI